MIKKLSFFIITLFIFFLLPKFSFAVSVSTLPIQPSQFSSTYINGKPITGFTAFDGYQTDCSGYSEYIRYYNENIPDTPIFQSSYTSSNFTIDQSQGLDSLTYKKQIVKGSCVTQSTTWETVSSIPIRTYIPYPLTSQTFLTSQNLVLKSGSGTSFFSNYGFTVGSNPLFLANYELPLSGLIITYPKKQLVKNIWETKEYINQLFTFTVIDSSNPTPNTPISNTKTRFYVFKFLSDSDRTNWSNPQKICDTFYSPIPTAQFFDCELTHTEQTNAYYEAVAVVAPQAPSLDLPYVVKLKFQTNYNSLINSVDSVVNPYDSVLSDLLNTFPTRPAFNCDWINLICIAEYLVKPYASDFEPLQTIQTRFNDRIPFGFISRFTNALSNISSGTSSPSNPTINIMGSTMTVPIYSAFITLGNTNLGLPFDFRDMMIFIYYFTVSFLFIKIIINHKH